MLSERLGISFGTMGSQVQILPLRPDGAQIRAQIPPDAPVLFPARSPLPLVGGGGTVKDMFGNEVSVDEARRLLKAKSKPQKRGYAAPPGSGPVGQTCKTCRHYRSVDGGSKRFPKCDLMRAVWNHSYGTDILARAPACRQWAPPDLT